MKDVTGSMGTWSGLALRVSQCVCAGASYAAMASTYALTTNNYSAFRFLMDSMLLQLVWSFTLGCFDIYALKTGDDLHIRGIAGPFAMLDCIIATLSFAAASASTGVAILFARDTNYCATFMQPLCSYYKLSAVLVYMTWSFEAASATSAFWLLASL